MDINMSDTKDFNDAWTAKWNDRFRKDGYAYGEEPNNYLKEQLAILPAGTILFPADGEGRNGVYAAKMGWAVTSFDISDEGKRKAIRLAEKNRVTLDYKVGQLETLDFETEQFDAIALIYAHFPADIRSRYHKAFDKYLKDNGTIILEAFGKKHIEYVTADKNVGGPKDLEMLFSIEEIKSDFSNYEIIELVEKEVELTEGLYHNGTGSVIRFTGRKKATKR